MEQQHLKKGFKYHHSSLYVKRDYKREGKQVLEEEPPKTLGKEKNQENPRERTSSHAPVETLSVLSFKGEVISHPNALPRGP